MFPRIFRLLSAFFLLAILVPSPGQQPRTDLDGDPLPDGATLRLGSTRWRHGGAGNAIAYSPDGKTILTGGEGGSLRLWDAATGRELKRIAVQEKQVNAVAFSPDGKKIAAAGSEGRVCIHDAVTGHELRTSRWTTQAIYTLVFSPDGNAVASAGFEGIIAIHDLSAKKKNLVLTGHDGVVTDVSFTPDGKALASASKDGTVRIWDLVNERSVCRIQEPNVEYRCAVFSPDGKTLAVAGTKLDKENLAAIDERLQVFDTTRLPERLKLDKPDGAMLKRLIADLDSDDFDKRTRATETLEIYGDLAKPAIEKALADKPALEMLRRLEALLSKASQGPPPPGPMVQNLSTSECRARVVAFSPDGQTLAAGERDGIRFYRAKDGSELQNLTGINGEVVSLSFAPDGKTLAYTEGSGVIGRALAPEVGRWGPGVKRASVDGPTAAITGVAFSPDGKTVASCALGEKFVRLWDGENGKELRQLPAGDVYSISVAFSADGTTLAAGGNMGGVGVRVWDTGTWKESHRIQTDIATWMFGIQFSPDGKMVAAVRWTDDDNGFIHRWDIASGKLIGTPTAWRKTRSAPAVFNGKMLAIGTTAKVIHVWDLDADEQKHELAGHLDEVARVLVSPDGKHLASVGDPLSRRKDVRLWDLTTGKEMHRLDLPSSQATAIAFSPDGKLFASGGNEGIVRMWKVPTGTLLREIKTPAGIESMAFSADGKRLATGGTDTAVLIWKVER
jgi:WD40 repeat protein